MGTKVEDSSIYIYIYIVAYTKATYRYLDNRMIHLQAAVTISEQDIIPVLAVSQTCGYLIWEQGVPNPTNNNTVLPSRTPRERRRDSSVSTPLCRQWIVWWVGIVPQALSDKQTDVLFFFILLYSFLLLIPFSIVNAASDEARSITRNTIPRLFTVVCRCQSPLPVAGSTSAIRKRKSPIVLRSLNPLSLSFSLFLVIDVATAFAILTTIYP